jgi:uncharacterized repeat protein (TIGR01451 family)
MNRFLLSGLVLMMGSSVSAQTFSNSGIDFGSIDTGFQSRGGVTITQNTDTATITALNSVACPADNDSYFRRFDLDGDHAIAGPFNVTSFDFGVESSAGNTIPGNELIVNLYSIPNASALVLANLTPVGTGTVSVADTGGTPFIQNAVITGTVDGSTDDLVVEILANDTLNGTTFFVGSNAAGQIGPTFLMSAGCGATDITDIATLGFPGMHMVLVVNGNLPPQDADLSVAVTNNAATPVAIGDQFQFTLTATNNGPADATGVSVVDTLSANLAYVSDTCGATNAAGTVTWAIGAMTASTSAVCNVTVQVADFGDISSAATISGNEPDPVANNNAGSNALSGVARIIPSLSLYGLLLLIAGMLYVSRRKRLFN